MPPRNYCQFGFCQNQERPDFPICKSKISLETDNGKVNLITVIETCPDCVERLKAGYNFLVVPNQTLAYGTTDKYITTPRNISTTTPVIVEQLADDVPTEQSVVMEEANAAAVREIKKEVEEEIIAQPEPKSNNRKKKE